MLRLKSRRSRPAPTLLWSLPRVGISHSVLTDLMDGAGLWHLRRTPGRTLSCGYGLRRTGRTSGTDLRIKRSFVHLHAVGYPATDPARAVHAGQWEPAVQQPDLCTDLCTRRGGTG